MEVTVKGTVESVVYFNSQNNYTVLQISTTENKIMTVVGNLPSLAVGEVLEVSGEVATHPRYGEQIVAREFKTSNPTSKSGIIKYLSSGLIKGVGEATARNIYEKFGNDTMNVIEENPVKLSEIKGISKKKAESIHEAIFELKKMQTQVMFLQQYNITTNLAVKIYNQYKEGTKHIVSQNPYKLVDDIDGVGFLTADKIAMSLGHSASGEFRIRASLVYCLKETAEKEGNTYLSLDDLIKRAEKLLNLELYSISDVVESTLERMALEPVVKLFTLDDVKQIALLKYYRQEQGIAVSLLKLNKNVKVLPIDTAKSIAHFQELNNFKFHSSQYSAVTSAVTNGVTVITGGPGTGKTTIINCIAELFSQNDLTVELCAPTGRASKRLSESTKREAKTIHRLLGYEFQNNRMQFKYNKDNKLNADVVIVDELSMVDVNIMYSLLKALKEDARLVLVGDKDQLPSVGAGNVLSDIIKSNIIEVNYLTHIYRQAEDSLIVTNAHLINQCQMPQINNQSKDFFVMNIEDGEEIAKTVVQLVKTRLPKYCNTASRDIQVLGAMKSGVAGTNNLNLLLQASINADTPLKKQMKSGTVIFREGDRVMQIVNDYEMPFTKYERGIIAEGSGVFNGDIGFIKSINNQANCVEIIFDDNRLCSYEQLELSNLQLAYASTIHKSQGSEFPVVVIPLVGGPPTIINKNLLYTAITRAKDMVVLVGSKKVLSMMIRNNYISKRTTLLSEFLTSEKLRHDRFFN